jgi:hypothetical protein
MGRGMRALTPASGPVERFACELRALRALAGDKPFWKMARRCSASKSALAAAAAGQRLPSQNVTREFVRACEGDWTWWQERWSQAAEELEAARHAPGKALVRTRPAVVDVMGSRTPAPIPADEPWAPMSEDIPERAALFPRPGRGWRPIGAVALAVIVLGAGFSWWAGIFSGTGSASGAGLRVPDGADPQAVGCVADKTVLATAPVRLQGPLILRGQRLAKGTQVGTVTLAYSPRCAGAWARFDPAPVIDTNLNDSTAGVTTVWAQRPADTTQNTWKMGHIDETYSELLLTGVGCVVAGARIDVTNENVAALGQTPCLPLLADTRQR